MDLSRINCYEQLHSHGYIFGEVFVAGSTLFERSSPNSLHWAAVTVLFLLGIIPYIYEYAQGHIDPFSPIMWIASVFVIVYGVGAAHRILKHNFVFQVQYTVTNPETVILEAFVLVTFGLDLLCYGYYRSWGRKIETQNLRRLVSEFRSSYSISGSGGRTDL